MDTGFLFAGTAIGYVFSYLYLLAMGRMLGPETYGILGALFAIFYSVCLIGQAMMEVIATNIASTVVRYGETEAMGVFKRLGIRLSIIFLVPALVLIIIARPIASFFHLDYTGPVILLAFAIFTALLINIILGLLQGLQKFRELGIAGYLVAQGLKLFTGVIFVWAGWGLMGATGALIIATAIGAATGLFLVRKRIAAGVPGDSRNRIRLGHIFLPTLLLAVFLSIPASVDVMLVTHYFGGEEAGLYNAAATLGKVVVFLPIAVSLIMLPRAAENHAKRMDTRKILFQAFTLTFIFSCFVAVICWLFSEQIITLFFGKAYLQAGSIVGIYALAMLFFSLNIVLMHYSLAVRNLWLMFMVDMVTISEVVVIVALHRSLTQIIWILIAGSLLILLVSLPLLAVKKKAGAVEERQAEKSAAEL